MKPDKQKLLIVDADAAILRLLEDYFRNFDYDILPAESSKAALSALHSASVSVAVVGVSSNNALDTEFIQECRVKHPDLKIILITGYPTIDMALKAVRLGLFDIIIKPFRLEQLHTAVGIALEQRNYHREIDGLRKEISDLRDTMRVHHTEKISRRGDRKKQPRELVTLSDGT